jgi:hypothetical protein
MGLGRWVQVLAGLAILWAIFEWAVTLWFRFNPADTTALPVFVATWGDAINVLALLPAGICFWIWHYRGHQKVFEADPNPSGLNWSLPWVFWGWVVPIISLFVPYQILSYDWRRMTETMRLPQGAAFPPSWMLAWWLLYVLNGVFGMFVAAIVEDSPGGFAQNIQSVTLYSAPLFVVAGILFIRIVGYLDRFYESDPAKNVADVFA